MIKRKLNNDENTNYKGNAYSACCSNYFIKLYKLT